MKLYSLFLLIVISNLSFSLNAREMKSEANVKKFCSKLDDSFKKYGWQKSDCLKYEWNYVRDSVKGDPLLWVVYGNAEDLGKPSFKEKDVTVFMCGVHGDEITPVKFCFDIMKFLDEEYQKENKEYQNKIVLVAPLVNPDSFFIKRPTRVNARGVDVNRNFLTKDWLKDARRLWISKFKKDKRRNPGVKPNSEPEVIFQVNLIKRYSPDKIISVHAPLTLLDYDGPNTIINGIVNGPKAEELLNQMSKDASDYAIENYPYFPGSLGNWAGRERDIPTYTLELPTSDPSKSDSYWKLFKSAIHTAIVHDLKDRSKEMESTSNGLKNTVIESENTEIPKIQ